ncbi:hypothetical protein jhhlp_007587 [Lomentospora prolificans]|uniref:Ureidoglycolate hydrolase n=1 Tax=Lomentospora prolificans TaxID=41688 RepID=A0A2N3N007_9PEZI|nr:hypothetical protein jhhlp_007587 [Lomentospora prolificans]
MPLQVSIGQFSLTVPAQPLTASSFAPFGDVIENPRRQLLPPIAGSSITSQLPYNAVSANQGTAIKYQHVSRPRELYAQAPSRVPAEMVINMFVCRSRPLHPVSVPAPTRDEQSSKKKKVMADAQTQTGDYPALLHEDVRPSDIPSDDDQSLIEELASVPKPVPKPISLPEPRNHQFSVTILERHPYTSQTFIPLSSPRKKASYLVIVAPTLPNMPDYPAMPTPRGKGLPGPGLPDLKRLKAFIASGDQAVTYGAGTWHAPMVVLGKPEDKVDFVVVQFANGVGSEDCQEVVLQSEAPEGGGVNVEIRGDWELENIQAKL